MFHKIKNVGLVALPLLAAVASHAQEANTPLEDLEAGISTMTTLGTTVAGVAVTLFVISMVVRFVRKGARA